jgi:NADH dehydrogenase
MHILLPGASGFVGSRVLEDLLAAGHRITAIASSERSSRELTTRYPGVGVVIGDVSSEAAMRVIEPGPIDAVVYLPGLLREFPSKGITFEGVHVQGVRNLIAVAKRLGAMRWIEMSALGVGLNAKTGYYRTKWQAEELVRASGLEWTIVRPSVVFDDRPTRRMNFVNELASIIRKAPLIPILGRGDYRMQPISLDDVSQTIVQSLGNPATIGKIYEMGGPEKLSYVEIARAIARAQGSRKPLIHIPFALVLPVVQLFQRFAFFPLTMDQIVMLKEENVVNDPKTEQEWLETFELPRKRFEESLRKYFAR